MGGGPQEPQESAEEYQPLVDRIIESCSLNIGDGHRAEQTIKDDYEEVDQVLKKMQNKPGILAKCAAHMEIVGQLRQLAQRYREVELTSSRMVESGIGVGDCLMDSLLPLQGALETNAAGVRSAIHLAVSRMSQLSTQLVAAAAAHAAVALELDKLVEQSKEVASSPAKADLGLKAAPVLGGAAGTAAAMLLRAAGPVGALGAVALVACGALGGSTAATVMYPQIRILFTRLQEEVRQVAAQMVRKVAALENLSCELAITSGQLASILDIVPDGSESSRQLCLEALHHASNAVEAVTLRCASCRYIRSPFFDFGLLTEIAG